MMLRFLFFGFCFLGIGILSAQDDDLPSKYREDQFYVSFALQLQQQDISGFKQNGFSNNFQIGFIRDIPINTKGTFALGLGVGYDYNRLVSNLNLSEIESKMKFSLTEKQKNLQTLSSIVFPVSIRLRSSTPYRTDFWRVYGGLKYRLLISSRFHPVIGASFKNDRIKKNNTAVFLSMGYNTWNLFLEYDLNSIYKRETALFSGGYLELQTLKIGLIFYLL